MEIFSLNTVCTGDLKGAFDTACAGFGMVLVGVSGEYDTGYSSDGRKIDFYGLDPSIGAGGRVFHHSTTTTLISTGCPKK